MSDVTRGINIDGYSAMSDANARLMSDIYNDSKLSPMEKIKGFSMGVRNQSTINRDMTQRRAEMLRYRASNSNIDQLTHNPSEK